MFFCPLVNNLLGLLGCWSSGYMMRLAKTNSTHSGLAGCYGKIYLIGSPSHVRVWPSMNMYIKSTVHKLFYPVKVKQRYRCKPGGTWRKYPCYFNSLPICS